jgi:hypothetical protein
LGSIGEVGGKAGSRRAGMKRAQSFDFGKDACRRWFCRYSNE